MASSITPRPRVSVRIRFILGSVLLFAPILTHAAPTTQPPVHPTTNASVAIPTTNPARTAEIAAWFADLANRDSSRRDAARQNLMGLSRDELPILRSLVEKNHPLAPSQTAALRDIVTQVFLSGEIYDAMPQQAPFLGVSYQGATPDINPEGDDGSPQSGVVVTDRLPGYPGYRYLQTGDVILGATEMGEDRINRPEDLQPFINRFHDGDTVHLKIFRAGQTIIVPVKLGAHPTWDMHQFLDIHQVPEVRQRQQRADDYWDTSFAQFIDDSVS